MAAARRTQVEAIDDLTAAVHIANVIAVLGMGATAIEHDNGSRASTPAAKARVAHRNELRAQVRVALGMERS